MASTDKLTRIRQAKQARTAWLATASEAELSNTLGTHSKWSHIYVMHPTIGRISATLLSEAISDRQAKAGHEAEKQSDKEDALYRRQRREDTEDGFNVCSIAVKMEKLTNASIKVSAMLATSPDDHLVERLKRITTEIERIHKMSAKNK